MHTEHHHGLFLEDEQQAIENTVTGNWRSCRRWWAGALPKGISAAVFTAILILCPASSAVFISIKTNLKSSNHDLSVVQNQSKSR
jgi:hypothetical protein